MYQQRVCACILSHSSVQDDKGFGKETKQKVAKFLEEERERKRLNRSM